jgi:hypothetical protein
MWPWCHRNEYTRLEKAMIEPGSPSGPRRWPDYAARSRGEVRAIPPGQSAGSHRQPSFLNFILEIVQKFARCGIVTSSPFMQSSRSPVSPRLSWRKTRGFLQFAEKFLHCMRNKSVGISASRTEMSDPYLGVFPLAERFSHLTLDVGVRLQADCPPKEC